MKRKYINQTYLRDVLRFEQSTFNEPDFFVSVKHIISTQPFVSRKGIVLINDGYYIVEVIPNNEKYLMRVFLDKRLDAKEYYFDTILTSGYDETQNSMFYDDGYIDVIFEYDGEIRVDDEAELEENFAAGKVTKAQYNLFKTTAKKLVKELSQGTNKYKNMDLSKYINSKKHG